MIIIMAVRWYLAYSLSYRQVEELLAERGIFVDHTTIHRWVVEYSPMLLKKFHKCKKKIHGSWRMDETYIKVKGKWHYLYRAVDKFGQTIDIYLSKRRDTTSAKLFFQRAFRSSGVPEKVNIGYSRISSPKVQLKKSFHCDSTITLKNLKNSFKNKHHPITYSTSSARISFKLKRIAS
jgi:transposase-like protein